MKVRTSGVAILTAIVFAQAMLSSAGAKPSLYMSDSEFVASVFSAEVPSPSSLIVPAGMREQIEAILDHRFAALRLKFWQQGDTTAWVIDEIGKSEPITIGVSVDAGRVNSVRVLEYRESRGSEIRFGYFTDQFLGSELTDDNRLDRRIDGITGATLSVDAMQKVVRVALLLDEHVRSGLSNERASY